MKRVLVTGGSGFVGRHCLPLLAQRDYDVHVVSSRPCEGRHGRWHTADLMDQNAMRTLVQTIQPTHLLHLAWITEPKKYLSSTENMDWLCASLQLLKAFQQSGGERVVVSGSCIEYDWNYGFCREDVTPLKPVTLYGQCKLSLQQTLSLYASQVGLSWGWGRLFFLYGPGGHSSRIPGAVIESLMRNEPARCSHGRQIRDFLHISDAAAALVAFLESDLQASLNIASGEPVTIREIALSVADHFERRDLLEFGAVPTAPNDPPLIVADVRRLRDELGWRPQHTLKSGLDATLAWRKGASCDPE